MVFADALAHAFECEDRQRDACWNPTNKSKVRARVFRLVLSSGSLMSRSARSARTDMEGQIRAARPSQASEFSNPPTPPSGVR